MKILCKYTGIKDFLLRFTLIKFKNFHLRVHKFKGGDDTSFMHNHPFNYISMILWGGYKETILMNCKYITKKRGMFSLIMRSHDMYHRIDFVKYPTITLFLAIGRYDWELFSTRKISSKDGIFLRNINNHVKWCKRFNGIWFIGNYDKKLAALETRYSIHQKLKEVDNELYNI